MALKDLEHDGDEDFLGKFPNRSEHRKAKTKFDKEMNSEERKEKEKAEAQAAWMHMNNPFLWNGEI